MAGPSYTRGTIPSFTDVVVADRTTSNTFQKAFDTLEAIEQAKKKHAEKTATGKAARDILSISDPKTFNQQMAGIMAETPVGVADFGAIAGMASTHQRNMQQQAMDAINAQRTQQLMQHATAAEGRNAALHPLQMGVQRAAAARAPIEQNKAILENKVTQDAYVDNQQARALTTPENITGLLEKYATKDEKGKVTGTDWNNMSRGLIEIGLRPEAAQKVMEGIYGASNPGGTTGPDWWTKKGIEYGKSDADKKLKREQTVADNKKKAATKADSAVKTQIANRLKLIEESWWTGDDSQLTAMKAISAAYDTENPKDILAAVDYAFFNKDDTVTANQYAWDEGMFQEFLDALKK